MSFKIKKITCLLIVLFLVGLSLFSCKKRKAFNSEEGETLVDVTGIRAHTDLVLIEACNAISNQFFLRGKPASGQDIQSGNALSTCAYVIDSSSIYSGKLTFNYTGNVCDNYKREGSVIASIQNYPTKKWKDKGAILKLEFLNYIATNVSENKSIKINGTEFITNESGGTWYELMYLNLNNVVNSISGNDIKVTFDKTNNVYYNVERRITFTIKGLVIFGSSEGAASQNNMNNVDCWGLDRDEKDFTGKIENPVVWSTKCSSLKPISGQVNVTVNDNYYDLKALYGTDADGNTSGSADCAYGWKMSWTLRNKTKSRVFSY